MKRKIMKVITAILVFSLLLGTTSTFAAFEPTHNGQKNARGIDAPKHIKTKMANDIMELSGHNFRADREVEVTEKYVEVIETLDDNTVQHTYLSLVTEDGLADMNEVAATIASNYDVLTNTKSESYFDTNTTSYYYEAIWSVSVTFGMAVNSGGYRFYRPTQVAASWAPYGSNSISMSSFRVSYISKGWLIESPECLADGLSYNSLTDLLINGETLYTHTISATGSNLAANRTIGRTNAIASGQAIWFANSSMHGSTVEIYCSYTCNGLPRNNVVAEYQMGIYYTDEYIPG